MDEELNNVENGANSTNNAPKDRKGLAIASLVLGILALVLFCIPYVPEICGILALIFGIIGLKSSKRGMSIAGIVTGILGIVLCVVLYIGIAFLGLSLFNTAVDSIDSIDTDAMQQTVDELEEYSDRLQDMYND